jgi:hypothetical protein
MQASIAPFVLNYRAMLYGAAVSEALMLHPIPGHICQLLGGNRVLYARPCRCSVSPLDVSLWFHPCLVLSQGVPEQTTPHFTEAKDGLAFVGGEVSKDDGRHAHLQLAMASSTYCLEVLANAQRSSRKAVFADRILHACAFLSPCRALTSCTSRAPACVPTSPHV